jgi:phosphoribosylglycinamide formyltransferase-1|tara:strand:+ start:118 stop:729 length:612 start_codon:yes stop_codon:yes gene_type:complete
MTNSSYKPLISLAIMASGSGSNAASIVKYFEKNKKIKILGIWTNSTKSGIARKKLGVPIHVFEPIKDDKNLIETWTKEKVSALILAGYLKPIPKSFIEHFGENILNIHPSLLPRFGGKGMYGMAVHKAVLESKEEKTGITVHVVTDKYDQGPIIFQCETVVEKDETVEMLQSRVLQIEHRFYPKVIESYCKNEPIEKRAKWIK